MSKATKAVILAAGLGTRMKSARPKVLHEVLGRPMINWVVGKALASNCEEVAVVVGHAKEDVMATVNDAFSDARVSFYEQKEMLGTGDAVRSALPAFEGFGGQVMILCGDVPNVPLQLLEELTSSTAKAESPVALITAIAPPGTHYGRIVRDEDGHVEAIVEYKDADEATREIREINTGNYLVDSAFLARGLSRLDTNNAQGEFYLTDLIRMAAEAGTPARAIIAPEISLLDGVNSRDDLGRANEVALRVIRGNHMVSGVTMEQPSTTWIGADVVLEADVTLESSVHLRGRTSAGAGARIQSFSRLSNCRVDAGVTVPAGTIADGEHFQQSTRS